MKRALFIYNPISGDRTVPDRLDFIISRFMEKDIIIQPYRITNGIDERLIDFLNNTGFSFIIISGGDGTLNTIINQLMNNGISLPVGIVPSGTCNDFAGSLDIPHDIKKSLDVILKGKISSIDVGVINDRNYFFGTCAGGTLVNVSFNTKSELKKSLGPFAYYMKAFSYVGNIKPFYLKVKTDNETVKGKFLLFMIMNGKHVAGFPNVAKEADISDGLMDIILVKNCMYIDLAAMFFKMLANDVLYDKNIISLKTSMCEIEGSKDVVVTIDGEKWDGLPINVKFIKRALNVFIP